VSFTILFKENLGERPVKKLNKIKLGMRVQVGPEGPRAWASFFSNIPGILFLLLFKFCYFIFGLKKLIKKIIEFINQITDLIGSSIAFKQFFFILLKTKKI
jgi:hypothetical protein